MSNSDDLVEFATVSENSIFSNELGILEKYNSSLYDTY